MRKRNIPSRIFLLALVSFIATGCHSAPPQQPPGSPTAINSNGIPNAAQGNGKMPAVLQRELGVGNGQQAPSRL